MNSDDIIYTPIDCGTYSEYEVAILHRQRLRLKWRDEESDEVQTEIVLPQDLTTEDKREYLIARGSDGSTRRIRLDLISEAATASA